MKGTVTIYALGAVALLSALPNYARADSYTLRKDSVIPVVFDNQLTIRGNRVGDRFSAHTDHDRDLPDGTRLNGRIEDIQKAYGNQPAEMRLRFTDIEFAGGGHVDLSAVPIPLSDKYVRRSDDGRLVARSNDKQRETMVIGGAVAGFVIGSILHKQLEGTLIGTAAGVILAEANRKNGSDLVIAKGQRMGALVAQDVRVDTDRYTATTDRTNEPAPEDRGPSGDAPRNDDQPKKDDVGRSGDQPSPTDHLSVGPIRISYENHDLLFGDKEMPYRAGDAIMVPLYRTVDQLGLHAEQTGDKVWVVEDQDNSLRLEQDSREYRLNGNQGTMSRPMAVRDDVIFVPLEVLAKIRAQKIYINGNRIDDRTD